MAECFSETLAQYRLVQMSSTDTLQVASSLERIDLGYKIKDTNEVNKVSYHSGCRLCAKLLDEALIVLFRVSSNLQRLYVCLFLHLGLYLQEQQDNS